MVIKKAKLDEGDLEVTIVLHELGRCLRKSGWYDEAEKMSREALALKKLNWDEASQEVTVTLHEFSVC